MSIVRKIKQQLKSRTVRDNGAVLLGAIATHVVSNPAILVAPSPATLIVAALAIYNIYRRNTTDKAVKDIQ